jgi:hypothetical protein
MSEPDVKGVRKLNQAKHLLCQTYEKSDKIKLRKLTAELSSLSFIKKNTCPRRQETFQPEESPSL